MAIIWKAEGCHHLVSHFRKTVFTAIEVAASGSSIVRTCYSVADGSSKVVNSGYSKQD